MVTKAIERAQKRIEMQNFSIRKHTLQYDDVMNNQRSAIYDRRNAMIDKPSHKEEVKRLISEVAERLVDEFVPEDGELDYGNLAQACFNTFLLGIDFKSEEYSGLTKFGLAEKLQEAALEHYHRKEEFLGDEVMRHLERYALLSTIDTEWREHLYEMDQMKSGIGLRAYGQRDPLIEYKKEAFKMFNELVDRIDKTAVSLVFKLQPVDQSQVQQRRQQSQARLRSVHESISGMSSVLPESEQPEETMPEKHKPIVRDMPKVGRNDPCPCGSGKKYKKCHGVE